MPSTAAILKSIQHPTRRQILVHLNESYNPVPYTALLPLCDNSTGKLNYHLRTLDDIVEKVEMGYVLSEKGEHLLGWLENIVSMGDQQNKDKPSIVFSRIFPDRSYRTKYYLILIISTVLTFSIPVFLYMELKLIFPILLVLITALVLAGLIHLYYQSIWYQITDTEVVVHKGIITKTVKIVPYRTMTNIELKQGLLDRLFKIGTVDIQTAGITRSGVEEKLVGLIDPEDVKETIIERIRLLNPLNTTNLRSNNIDISGLEIIRSELQSLNKELKDKG